MMILDVKNKVDRLPTDGITPEMLDAVLERGNFRPKTDALLKEANGCTLQFYSAVERQKAMQADPSYQYVGVTPSILFTCRAKGRGLCFFAGIHDGWSRFRSRR